MSLNARISAPGPKKILACDGGGILGLMSVEILARLEEHLRHARQQPGLVLADFFDFVCGTSTGAIIAACISAGMSMAQIREFYVGSGRQMFDKAFLLKRLNYSYNSEPLARKLREELNRALGRGQEQPWATLGDPGLRTLLMMVMRNHSTDSPWPVWNNPAAKYNRRTRDDGSPRLNCNLDLPLWQLVRASAAAPTFFPPEVVTLAEGTPEEQSFIFVDGGVTTYNNPAWLAFQMATAAPYGLNWATGTDQLLLVSVGTGSVAKVEPRLEVREMDLIYNALNVPRALMNAASAGWDMACRTVGACRFGREVDREFGAMLDVEGERNFNGPKLFSYVRYDPDVSQEGLDELGLKDIDAAKVQVMDSVGHIADIQRVGRQFAEQHVHAGHLAPFV